MNSQRFNEAAGFTQRKRVGGNGVIIPEVSSFNEAAGFTQRKPPPEPPNPPPVPASFNEAAGFTQRKQTAPRIARRAAWRRFNEAAGFTQRKPKTLSNKAHYYPRASMRPPVLPSGNNSKARTVRIA